MMGGENQPLKRRHLSGALPVHCGTCAHKVSVVSQQTGLAVKAWINEIKNKGRLGKGHKNGSAWRLMQFHHPTAVGSEESNRGKKANHDKRSLGHCRKPPVRQARLPWYPQWAAQSCCVWAVRGRLLWDPGTSGLALRG